ncbi:MAG: hypothetical protein ACM30G_06240, partial [Micromonosporaceae bacterium]
MVEALDQIIATYVFGADRHAYLGRALAGRPTQQHQDAAARRADILRAQLDDIATRQDRLIEELETTDPTDRTFQDRLLRWFRQPCRPPRGADARDPIRCTGGVVATVRS